jgi:hypothetical protein
MVSDELRAFIVYALQEDLGSGDVTSRVTIAGIPAEARLWLTMRHRRRTGVAEASPQLTEITWRWFLREVQ